MKTFEELMKWQEDIEKRISELERRLAMPDVDDTELTLTRKYGLHVDKTVAAQVLGVTRATVYAMLADGRIEGSCGGKRVSVSSIARYLHSPGMKKTGGETDAER